MDTIQSIIMVNVNAEDVFNPKDFESIELKIDFKNLTTNTKIEQNKSITLIEIGDKTLTLEVPTKSCNHKHNVMLSIQKVEKKNHKFYTQTLFSTTGKIRNVENLDETLKIEVDCIQFEEKEWQDLQQLFAKRQDEITKFFKSVKGY